MNTKRIMSRANELKEFELKKEIVYIRTKEERDAVLWMFKRTLKIKEDSEASNEIEIYFDLFIPIFSLNVITGILYHKYKPFFSLVDKYTKDEIKRIILCTGLIDRHKEDSVIDYFDEALYLYNDYKEKQKIEKN